MVSNDRICPVCYKLNVAVIVANHVSYSWLTFLFKCNFKNAIPMQMFNYFNDNYK